MDDEEAHKRLEAKLGQPSAQQQSVGAIVAIVVILIMVVVGAYYAWHRKVSQLQTQESATTTTR